jgi:membrane protein YqaA with SNARE-associated domain
MFQKLRNVKRQKEILFRIEKSNQMRSKVLKRHIRKKIRHLQLFADRIWYPPLLGFLAALDNLILVIPNDGLLISSSMLTPRKWLSLAISVTIGSTLGALALIAVVKLQGLPWILAFYPGVDQSDIWLWSLDFFQRYGMLLVFFVALTPIAQQPAVILASLAQSPTQELCFVVFSGRLIKFIFLAYLASHTPRLISKLWGVQRELKGLESMNGTETMEKRKGPKEVRDDG